MTSFFIGLAIGIVIGVFLPSGDKIVYQIKKLRAKKGGVIEVDQDNTKPGEDKKEQRKQKRAARKAAKKQ